MDWIGAGSKSLSLLMNFVSYFLKLLRAEPRLLGREKRWFSRMARLLALCVGGNVSVTRAWPVLPLRVLSNAGSKSINDSFKLANKVNNANGMFVTYFQVGLLLSSAFLAKSYSPGPGFS